MIEDTFPPLLSLSLSLLKSKLNPIGWFYACVRLFFGATILFALMLLYIFYFVGFVDFLCLQFGKIETDFFLSFVLFWENGFNLNFFWCVDNHLYVIHPNLFDHNKLFVVCLVRQV